VDTHTDEFDEPGPSNGRYLIPPPTLTEEPAMPTRDTAPAGAPCWVDLMTSDTDRSRAFYGQLFGWTADEPNEDFGGYFNFRLDGLLIAGGMSNAAMGGTGDVWSVYLAVDDAGATADAAAANGGSVLSPPMDVADLGRMAVVNDAGGASIGMWQPGTHKGLQVLDEPGAPSWFELHTRDYDGSVDFYRKVFGWDAHTAADEPGFRYTTLGEGDGSLAGIMDASAFLPEGVPAHWSVYFAVEDAAVALDRAVELGASVVQPAEDTPYGRLATASDPNGAVFKLRSTH
jgi:predicted enzyme related to lactoylglutathione lyase